MNNTSAVLSSVFVVLASTSFALTSASLDYTSYGATASPSSVVLSFADDALSRGFAWQTDSSVSEAKVWLVARAQATESDFNAATPIVATSKTVVSSTGTYNTTIRRHLATTGQLTPGVYSYRLGGNGRYAYGSFTVRSSFERLTILNFNDAQTKDLSKLYVWENTVSNATTVCAAPDFVIYGGDLYDENAPALKPQKYRQWALSADTASRYLPGVPWAFSSGNHDYSVYADCVAGWTATTPAGCRAVTCGNVHVATLPYLGGWSETAYQPAFDWLDADLQALGADVRWRIVALHWGPYTTGDHFVDVAGTKEIIKRLTPVLARHHVDLVLQAHDHTASKTLPYRWDGAGYTKSLTDAAVVRLAPERVVVEGCQTMLNPAGTVYVSCGCAGHRVGEGKDYANVELGSAKAYVNAEYKIVCDRIAVDSPYARVGDNASRDLDASMFGVIAVEGDTLNYDFYAVATNGLSAPVRYDTLRVTKRDATMAQQFSVTPYVQHPATNAMSLLFFTKELGSAKVTLTEPMSQEVRSHRTFAVWARALTNNLTTTDNGYAAQYRHRVRFEGLRPATRYDYVVELANVAYTNSFRTAPLPDADVCLIYYNDSETQPDDKCTGDWTDPKTGKDRTYYVSKKVGYATNIVHMAKRNPDLYVIAGDLAAKGGKQQNWDEFWRHNAGSYNDPAGSVPILAAIGNHDLQDETPIPSKAKSGSSSGFKGTCENGSGGEPALARYLSYFEYEPNGVKYEIGDGETFVDYQTERDQLFHRLEYGPVTLIFLDTNNGTDTDFASGASYERDTNTGLFRNPTVAAKYGLPVARSPDFNPGSKQYAWFTNCLAEAQVKSKFTFVVCHHCPYSVGYHNRTNIVEEGEWLSARAVRVLNEAMLKYGVDAMLCGHDEMVEHSRIEGTETLPGGGTRPAKVEIFDMGTAGDGLRGQVKTKEYNPREVWRAHVNAPETYDANGVLTGGGKHYGHMEINVFKNAATGTWQCEMTPVYIFVSKDKSGKVGGFDRRTYDDVTVLDGGRYSVGRGITVHIK